MPLISMRNFFGTVMTDLTVAYPASLTFCASTEKKSLSGRRRTRARGKGKGKERENARAHLDVRRGDTAGLHLVDEDEALRELLRLLVRFLLRGSGVGVDGAGRGVLLRLRRREDFVAERGFHDGGHRVRAGGR
jgi:hypothetical protein